MAGTAVTVVAADNFLIPNWTFVVELIAFLIVLAVVGRFILPRVRGPLESRRRMVRKQIEDSDRARERLTEAQRAYNDALQEARQEAAHIREGARAEAQGIADERRAAAQQEYERIVARGEAQLSGQRDVIMRELRTGIGTLAVELSEKIVDQDLAEQAQVTTTVDAFLAGLAAEDEARTGADT